jgi:putative membrane protein
MITHFLVLLKGIAMGAADVVPGVSGGTIAFITGIYDDLLSSIKNFLPSFKHLFRKAKDGENLTFAKRLKLFWRGFNGSFIFVLLAGIALSFVLFAKFIRMMIHEHSVITQAFFFGLIVASVILMFIKIKSWKGSLKIWNIVMLVLGCGLALLLPESTSLKGPDTVTWWYLLLAAMISICAMILPGISGSFVLVLLGAYNAFLFAVETLNIPAILLYVLGAAIGLIAFSSFLHWLLKKFYNQTICLLIGFIIGSLNIIWPWKAQKFVVWQGVPYLFPNKENVTPELFSKLSHSDSFLWQAILACIFGILLVLGIELLSMLISRRKKSA